MPVNIIFSLTNGGAALSSTLDLGSSPNSDTTDATEVFVRHDGDNEITDAKLYMEQVTSYSGSATAAADFSEIRGWGDGVTEASFGGIQFNMNASSSYPTTSWSTYSSKSPTGGAVIRTGTGDSSANGITLSSLSGCSADGTIQAGSSPNVRFKVRIEVPANEDTIGIRQFNLTLAYTYTS